MITKLREMFFYFYYKGTFSVMLLALVDDKYGFTAIQVSDFGRNCDDGVYANSPFGRALVSKTLQVPQDAFLPGGEDLGKMPYKMLGDAAFPLKPSLIRPYAGHNISYEKYICIFSVELE
jgi:hypothetical protein